MKKFIFAFLATLISFSSLSYAQDWKMDESKSKLTFSISADGSLISGQFEKFTTVITLDPGNPSGANIKATIEADSLKADDGTAASTALGASWLFVKKFPQITYQSSSVTKTSDGSFVIEGMLSVKDVSKPLKLPFTLKVTGNDAVATGKVVIDRATFGLGDPGDAGPTIEEKLLKKLSKNKKVTSSRKVPLSAKAVIVTGGLVLLLKQKDGRWDLPGGKLDKRETVLRALKREVKEETNLKITPIKPLSAVIKPREDQKDLLVISYLCTTESRIHKKLKLSDEHKSYKLVPLKKALSIAMRSHHKRALKCASSTMNKNSALAA